LIFKGATNHSV